MNNIINYFVFKNKTIFLPFRFLYPECSLLIKDHPQLSTLVCFKNACHVNKGCSEIMAKRIHYFFEQIEPLGECIISYFTHPNYGTSIKAGVFNKSLDEPRLITVNKTGFEKFKNESIIKQWIPTKEFININNFYLTDNIIPIENLIK